jgi:hypothetical protein
LEGEKNRKSAPETRSTFDLDLAAMSLGNGAGDAEPESRAAFAPRAILGRAVKSFEDFFLVSRG